MQISLFKETVLLGSGSQKSILVAEGSDLFLTLKAEDCFWSCGLMLLNPFRFRSFSSDVSLLAGLSKKIVIVCFPDSFVQQGIQHSNGSSNILSDTEFSYKLFKQQPFFLQTLTKVHCEQKLLCCLQRRSDVLPFQFPISDSTNRRLFATCYKTWLRSVSTTNTWIVQTPFFKYRFKGKTVVKRG